MTEPRRAVIEYLFRGYSEPGEYEAFGIEARVMSATGVHVSDTDLQAIRATLADLGLTMHGTQQLKTHHMARYNPRWREVWTEVKQ